jgi:hypothetical protein
MKYLKKEIVLITVMAISGYIMTQTDSQDNVACINQAETTTQETSSPSAVFTSFNKTSRPF